MWRYLAGGAGALLLAGGGIMLWQSMAGTPRIIGPAPATAGTAISGTTAEPPAATEATREEKRFRRYDKDRNGAVSREEWLASRRKAYAKLDTNGDGRLSFDEWAIKTGDRFARADSDKSGILTAAEFATTRIVRIEKRPPPCIPEAD